MKWLSIQISFRHDLLSQISKQRYLPKHVVNLLRFPAEDRFHASMTQHADRLLCHRFYTPANQEPASLNQTSAYGRIARCKVVKSQGRCVDK